MEGIHQTYVTISIRINLSESGETLNLKPRILNVFILGGMGLYYTSIRILTLPSH